MNDIGIGLGGDYLQRRVELGHITQEEATLYRKWDRLSGSQLEDEYEKWEDNQNKSLTVRVHDVE